MKVKKAIVVNPLLVSFREYDRIWSHKHVHCHISIEAGWASLTFHPLTFIKFKEAWHFKWSMGQHKTQSSTHVKKHSQGSGHLSSMMTSTIYDKLAWTRLLRSTHSSTSGWTCSFLASSLHQYDTADTTEGQWTQSSFAIIGPKS